ncbi:hypothetical protein [Wenzhouxiangella sp. EGI_FJ10409]|uniref:hypothetical protein n=1 Tax=Wenzhouxiangella sp. EGI_FJ10409 TaxID=3243767 RepID=UPI0035E2020F
MESMAAIGLNRQDASFGGLYWILVVFSFGVFSVFGGSAFFWLDSGSARTSMQHPDKKAIIGASF